MRRFLTACVREGSPRAAREREADLTLFLAYLRAYHPGVRHWHQVDQAHWDEFLGYFYVHKVLDHSATGAIRLLSGLRALTRWVDRTFGTSTWAILEPVYRRYRRTLPNALRAERKLTEWIRETQLRTLRPEAVRATLDWFLRLAEEVLAQVPGVRGNPLQVVERARPRPAVLAGAAREQEGDEVVEGLWWIEEVAGDRLVLVNDDTPDLRAAVPVPADVAALLEPGWGLFATVLMAPEGARLVDGCSVYPT